MDNAPIQVGDRVTWRHRWFGQEDEQMVGTVIEIGDAVFGPYAWMSVENDQSPLYARLDKLTKIEEVSTDGYSTV